MNSMVALLTLLLMQATPQFDVASIKVHREGGPSMIDIPPNGRVNILNATVRMIVRSAYRMDNYQIIGGPDWLNADRFDIQAKPAPDFKPKSLDPCFAPDCPLTEARVMLQGLLSDRFQLKSHRESRELQVYELTIGKNGFKLKEVAPPPTREAGAALPPPPPPPPPGTGPPTSPSGLPTPPPGIMMNFGNGFAASAVSFAALPQVLSEILGRRVIDKTGIKGFYDFKLVYSREGIPNIGFAPPPPLGGPNAGLNASDPVPSIFTAVQEWLGLKLDSTKGPVEILVIEGAQKPEEN